MTASHALWYTDRAAGLTALLLLSLAMCVGLVLRLGVAGPRWPRFVTNELHRFVTLVALAFVALHGVTVLADPYTGFTLSDVLVPLASSYHPLAMAAGIVCVYLLAAVWISTALRRRIGYRRWRQLHLLAFGGYALGVVHALTIGSDSGTPWGEAAIAFSVLPVVVLAIARVARSQGILRFPRGLADL